MGTLSFDMSEIFQRPAIVETLMHAVLCLVPLWVAVMVGIVIGWLWKPRWASLVILGLNSRPRLSWITAPPGLGTHRLWFAVTALSAFPILRKLWYCFKPYRDKDEQPPGDERDKDEQPPGDERDKDEQPTGDERDKEEPQGDERDKDEESPGDESVQEPEIVTFEDLDFFFRLLEDKDGGPVWKLMMDKSTPNITYQAWHRDPEIGPTQYRTRTIFEDVTPELVRDFFWDDDFRPKWDDMLIHFKTLEECPRTGCMISHWIRKLPLFCSDREYIIGRRIWESGRTYFCVTKAVPYPSLPRRNKSKCVDTYHSCWRIQAVESRKGGGQHYTTVESRKGGGQLTACEVMFFHQEDTGLPKELVKFAVRQGMWAQVKKLCHGLYIYQNEQMSEPPVSHCAFMARINTKVPASFLSNLGSPIKTDDVVPDSSAQVSSAQASSAQVSQVSSAQASSAQVSSAQGSSNARKGNRWKWAIVGGVIVLVCCLDKGVLSKAFIFGATRRLKNLRKKNDPR